MHSTYSPQPLIPMDSVVISDSSLSQKPTTTLFHSSNSKMNHHLYNYWTLNERLRSKNEKLSRRQQSSCRLAFYSLWLLIFAGVMTIIVYRFTDECSLNEINREQLIFKCFRYILLLIAICTGLFACSGVIFGACRYFRSQPKPFLYSDQYELRLTQNYDVLPIRTSRPHSCCCQSAFMNDAVLSPSQHMCNHNDEHSNITLTSSLQNLSPQRKMPPLTYEELPPTQLFCPSTLPSLPTLSDNNINRKPSNSNKNTFVSSSTTSTSSSPQSILPPTSLSTNHKRKSTLTFEDASPSTPTSYTTCIGVADVWERQQRPSILLSPR